MLSFFSYLISYNYFILLIFPILLFILFIFKEYKSSIIFLQFFLSLIIMLLLFYIIILYYLLDQLMIEMLSPKVYDYYEMYPFLVKALYISWISCVYPSFFSGLSLFIYYNIYNYFIIIFLILCTLSVFISMYNYFQFETNLSVDLPLLILLSLQGSIIIINANDFFSLYLGIEIQSLSLYVLAAIKKYSNVAVEAGLKYFLLGSFASGILLFGISFIYGFLGTLDFFKIYIIISSTSPFEMPLEVYFGLFLFLIGILFKLGVAPFHVWIGEVYQGSLMVITYFFSVVPKLSIFFMFYKVFYLVFFNLFSIFSYIFLIISLLSILIGSILTFYEINIKKFFAYSTISQMGYILLSFSIGSYWAIISSFYYFLIYLLILINIFSILMVFQRKSKYMVEYKRLIDLCYLKDNNFFLAIFLSFSFFSLASIPPFSGFFAKFLILLNLISTSSYLIIIILLLFSVFSAIYYIRLIRFIWFMDMYDYNYINLNISLNLNIYFIILISFVNILLIFFQIPVFYVLFYILC